MSPTARSTKLLEAEGWLVDIVERRITRTVKRDLFGFGDLFAVRPGEARIVQTTTSPNFAARRTKILASEHLPAVRAANISVEVHGWNAQKNTCRRELL